MALNWGEAASAHQWTPRSPVEDGLSTWEPATQLADSASDIGAPPGLGTDDFDCEDGDWGCVYDQDEFGCGGLDHPAAWSLEENLTWDFSEDAAALFDQSQFSDQLMAMALAGHHPETSTNSEALKQDPTAPCYIALSSQAAHETMFAADSMTDSSVFAIATQQRQTGRRRHRKRRNKLDERGPVKVALEVASDSDGPPGTPAASARTSNVVDTNGLPLDVNDLGKACISRGWKACISRTLLQELALMSRLEASSEVWERCAERRQIDLNVVKNWGEYQKYLAKVPRHMRDDDDPKTPDHKDRSKSKRHWKREVGDWRAAIMAWDPQYLNSIDEPECANDDPVVDDAADETTRSH